jgi:hypothetical protein
MSHLVLPMASQGSIHRCLHADATYPLQVWVVDFGRIQTTIQSAAAM